ncbi:MAG: phosphomethylpyrimidine synthase ThiC [bacterium]
MISYLQNELDIQEIQMGLISKKDLLNKVKFGNNVIVRGKKRNVAIGPDVLSKVISLVGLGSDNKRVEEMKKIEALANLPYKPDIFGDASIRNEKQPLYLDILKVFDGPVSTNPTFCSFREEKGIDEQEILETVEKQAEQGITYMVIHAAVTKKLYELACKTRKIPTTSRGGTCILRDMQINNKSEGIYIRIFPKLLKILKKHRITMSLGTTFRAAANIFTFDQVHLEELSLQSKLIKMARDAGVRTILEVLSHSRLDQIDEFSRLIQKDKQLKSVPINALGPLGTDSTLGYDHVNAAATASYAAYKKIAHIFVVVTRSEHIGGIPSYENIIEGLKCMRTAIHIANVARYPQLDQVMGQQRNTDKSCMLSSKGLFPEEAINIDKIGKCTRCGNLCPYISFKK